MLHAGSLKDVLNKKGLDLNNIFKKNIEALMYKNPKLVNKLQGYIPTEVPELVQENGAYNLKYKGLYIHNRQNPLGEAKEIFSMASNEPVAIHLIYGLGLGYLFQVASLNSIGTVILYEPDLNILWTAFTLVDFSNDILKNNVYITDNIDDAASEIYKKSNTINIPQMISLPSASEFNQEGFETLVRTLQEIVGTFSLDLRFTKEKFYPSLKMLIQNIPNLIKEPPLARFKDKFKGKTAVIVSAGPSLDRNIEVLKKYRDKYILITVGTAIKTLYKNELMPDFLCIIETYNSSKQVEGLDLSNVYFITEPYASPELRNFKYKKIFSHISANSPINHFWAEVCGENIEEYWSKGTVSYTAINSARILGCSKIILVGQDLAYIEGQCYSKDSAYKDLSCEYNKEAHKWEITAKDFDAFSSAISSAPDAETRSATAKRRLERLNNSLYYVKGIKGDMIPTESVYAAFVKPLSEFAEHFKGIKYINTSLVGAQIDGYENMPLEEALKDSQSVETTDFDTTFEYDTKLITSNLINLLTKTREALKYINEGKQILKNLSNDLKRKKNVDQDVLKLLKKASLIYLELIGEFSEKNKLYDLISVAGKIDLDYELKMMRDFNYENIIRITEKINNYFNSTENGINEIGTMLEGVLNESFNTKG